MEIQELKDKKKELEFNVYSLILDFIQETKVSDFDLQINTTKSTEIGSGNTIIIDLEIKTILGI
jgi:hypothetical protein